MLYDRDLKWLRFIALNMIGIGSGLTVGNLMQHRWWEAATAFFMAVAMFCMRMWSFHAQQVRNLMAEWRMEREMQMHALQEELRRRGIEMD